MLKSYCKVNEKASQLHDLYCVDTGEVIGQQLERQCQ